MCPVLHRRYMTLSSILKGGAALFFLLILNFSADAQMISEMQVKKLFPKVESLEGGAELWLNTGVRSKREENRTVFSTTYSYYSGRAKKMMNIVRKGQYETNIALYSFSNFVDASMYFRKLTKDAPKNRSQQVRFGERGLFFLYPKSGYINDADFYLVFINKTFVVWIYANDGFALMDIANPLNEALNRFITENTAMYLIKKLTLEAHSEGYKLETKQLEFTTDFPASIKVSGKVFSKDIDKLETGDSLLTDSEGYFEHKILLDGISDIELSTNFYLELDEMEKLTRFKGGFLESGLVYNKNGKTRNQLWNLETAGNKIFGTSYVKTSKGYKSYPIKGEIKGEDIELTLDCRRSGSDFGCEQLFRGRLQEGGLEGTWSGTGGGGIFRADNSKYKPASRKIILSEKTAQIKTFAVGFDGKLQKSSDELLNIAGGRDSNAMIFVKTDRDKLKLDPMKNISVKLVLTHLPDNQTGAMSIFKYGLKREGIKAYLSGSSFAGQLFSSEEPYKVEIDITDIVTEGGGAFLIGGAPEAGSIGNHNFSPAQSQYEALKPYIIVTEYSADTKTGRTERPFIFAKDAKKEEDILGDRNRPGKDGRPDYCFDALFSYSGKRLTGFELEIRGEIKRRYNTNPLDIYPLVGFIKDGKLINDAKGGIDYTFSKASEKLKICVNGSYVPKKTDSISYKYYIDDRPFEGLVQ